MQTTGRVIFNPGAGSADDSAEFEAAAAAVPDLAFERTEREGHAADLAEAAATSGERFVVAAGGDGTVSEVVVGLMRGREKLGGDARPPALLVAPLGTGNDLARTLGLRGWTAAEVLTRMAELHPVPLDVISYCLTGPDGERRGWSVNVMAGGFSSKLQASMTGDLKKRWGPLAYLRAAVGEVAQLSPHKLTYRVDGGRPETLDVLNAVVANARFAGGGVEVAPPAKIGDGQLDLMLVKPGGFVDLAELSAAIVAGHVDEDDLSVHIRGRRFDLEADPPMPFNVDGDRIGAGCLEAEVVPDALTVLCPPPTGKD